MRFHVHERVDSPGGWPARRDRGSAVGLLSPRPVVVAVGPTARRPTRRRLLALAGAGAAALAGCGTQPGACSAGVPVELRDVTVADAEDGWTLSGTAEATFRRTEGSVPAVAVVAFDADGAELARDEVGTLDSTDGEPFDDGSCEGARVEAPFDLSTATLPARVAVGGGASERACADDGLDVQPREYVRDDDADAEPTDFEGGWTERPRECGSGETDPPEGELVAVTDEPTEANGSATPQTERDGSTTTSPSRSRTVSGRF